MKKSIFLMITFVAASTIMYSQATASATATATIVAPISLTKTVDMNFGNVAVIASGTVILSPESARTPTGGVTLPVVTGTVTAASFDVAGEGSYTYAITLPSTDYTITKAVTLETMIVNDFVSSPTVAAGGVLTAGSQTLLVGATLNVGAAQVAGLYTNATGFDVTVNYN